MWRGRDPNDGKLNAMTLSSGLDDYPRASSPDRNELHLDVLCWLARGAAVIRDVAVHLGEQEITAEFELLATQLSSLVIPIHFNTKAQMFQDKGTHANRATFAKRIMV